MTLCQTLVGWFDSGDARYGPWLTRRENAARFRCERIGGAACRKLDLVGQRKSADGAESSAASAVAFASVTRPGTSAVRATNLEEFMHLEGTAIPLAGNTTWLRFRMLPPVWKSQRRVRR